MAPLRASVQPSVASIQWTPIPKPNFCLGIAIITALAWLPLLISAVQTNFSFRRGTDPCADLRSGETLSFSGFGPRPPDHPGSGGSAGRAAEVGTGLFFYALSSSAHIKTPLIEDARLVGDYEILFRDQNDGVLGRVRRTYAGGCEELISFDAPRAVGRALVSRRHRPAAIAFAKILVPRR